MWPYHVDGFRIHRGSFRVIDDAPCAHRFAVAPRDAQARIWSLDDVALAQNREGLRCIVTAGPDPSLRVTLPRVIRSRYSRIRRGVHARRNARVRTGGCSVPWDGYDY